MIGLVVTGIWAVSRVSWRSSRSIGICLRFAFVSMLAVWLAGCGLPSALSIISSVANGISFISKAPGDRRPAKVIVSSDTAGEFAACFWAISAISRETQLRSPFCQGGKALLREPEAHK